MRIFEGIKMRISQIWTNFQTKRPSFQKVNEKFFKQAVEDCNKHRGRGLGHLLTCIDIEEAYGKLSPQDAIDTLNAIKPYAQNALKAIEYMIWQISGNLEKNEDSNQ